MRIRLVPAVRDGPDGMRSWVGMGGWDRTIGDGWDRRYRDRLDDVCKWWKSSLDCWVPVWHPEKS